MILKQGTKYAATIELGWPESSFVSQARVIQVLTNYGFSSVMASGSGSYWKAIGTWTGPDKDVVLPSSITKVEAVG